jgi:hypothetical protein
MGKSSFGGVGMGGGGGVSSFGSAGTNKVGGDVSFGINKGGMGSTSQGFSSQSSLASHPSFGSDVGSSRPKSSSPGSSQQGFDSGGTMNMASSAQTSGYQVNNQGGLAIQTTPRETTRVMTGRERRSSFDSFSPIYDGGRIPASSTTSYSSSSSASSSSTSATTMTGRDRRASWGSISSTYDGGPTASSTTSYDSSFSAASSAVQTGSERRASWESYAPGSSYGTVGSPGGGEWSYPSGFGAAKSIPASSAFSPIYDGGSATLPTPSSSAPSTTMPLEKTYEEDTSSNYEVDTSASSTAMPMPQIYKEDEMLAEDTASKYEVDTVPMNTPARQSLPSNLSLQPIPGKGMGVIALEPISNGEYVGDYKGEVMSEEVKDRRYLPSLKDQQTEEDRQWVQSRLDRGQTVTGDYLYGISLPNPRGFLVSRMQKNDDQEANRIYVDAEDEYESLWTRFINHASPPNNNLKPHDLHESWNGEPRVWFVAKRDIEVGEELCFDYGDDYWLEGDDVA